MEEMEKEYTLSLYSNLSALRNSQKSSVYLVRNELNGKVYIKKELKTYNIEVFRRLKNITHKNTPRIYEFIELENTLYIIEEFINGDTLEEILKEKGPLDEDIVIDYVLDLCDILKVLHNERIPIIHRDIKPSNIIISNDGVLKLIDFDVSRIYKDEGKEDTYILGTKGYASPEQFGFDQTDCRSDIYSLGVLMNVLTTGDYPRNRKNKGKLGQIIEKCTHIAAEKRYESVMELREELKRLCSIDEGDFIQENINSNADYNEETYKAIYEKVYKDIYDEVYEEIQYKEAQNKVGYHKENHNEGQGNEEGYPNEQEAKTTSKDYQLHLKDKNGNRVESKVINFINGLPGFRSSKPTKMILAICWYIFMVAAILISFDDFNIFLLLENVSMVIILLLITFLNGNYKNIRSRLPLVNSNNRSTFIFGLILYNFILFMIGGSLLGFFQGLY